MNCRSFQPGYLFKGKTWVTTLNTTEFHDSAYVHTRQDIRDKTVPMSTPELHLDVLTVRQQADVDMTALGQTTDCSQSIQ